MPSSTTVEFGNNEVCWERSGKVNNDKWHAAISATILRPKWTNSHQILVHCCMKPEQLSVADSTDGNFCKREALLSLLKGKALSHCRQVFRGFSFWSEPRALVTVQ